MFWYFEFPDADFSCFWYGYWSENLEELVKKGVFETMFCLHEVSPPSILLFLLAQLQNHVFSPSGFSDGYIDRNDTSARLTNTWQCAKLYYKIYNYIYNYIYLLGLSVD